MFRSERKRYDVCSDGAPWWGTVRYVQRWVVAGRTAGRAAALRFHITPRFAASLCVR